LPTTFQRGAFSTLEQGSPYPCCRVDVCFCFQSLLNEVCHVNNASVLFWGRFSYCTEVSLVYCSTEHLHLYHELYNILELSKSICNIDMLNDSLMCTCDAPGSPRTGDRHVLQLPQYKARPCNLLNARECLLPATTSKEILYESADHLICLPSFQASELLRKEATISYTPFRYPRE